MSLKAQAARGIKWQIIELVGGQLLSFAVFAVVARLLQPADFGVVGLVWVYLAFVGMFVDQGIGAALIQRKNLESQHLNAAFWFNVTCAVLVCLATLALAGPVSRWFGEPNLPGLLRWASPLLIVNAATAVHTNLLVREMDFKQLTIRRMIANTSGGAVGIGMATAGFGAWSLVGQQLTVAAVGAVVLWAASPWRPQFTFSWAHLRDLLGLSLSVFSVGFLWFFSSRIDQAVIGWFLGTSALGTYLVAGKLIEFLKIGIGQPIAAVSLPALSKLQDDLGRLRHAVYQGMNVLTLVAIPCFVGLATVAPTAVPLLFGPKWIDAVLPMQLLSFFALANVLQMFFHPTLLATGGPGSYVILNVLHALGTAIACLVGVRFGLETLILGLIVNTVGIGVLAFRYVQRRAGFEAIPFWKPCLAPGVASTAMALAIFAMPDLDSLLLSLALQIALGVLVFGIVVRLLAQERVADLVTLVSFRLPLLKATSGDPKATT